MGLLGTNQREGIAAGNKMYHTWHILVPEQFAATSWESKVLDRYVESTEANRVIDPGYRRFRAVGVNMSDKRKFLASDYQIEVRNDDGWFYSLRYPGPSDDAVWKATSTGYWAAPQQCKLQHDVYVRNLAGSMYVVLCINYVGWIRELKFVDSASVVDGAAAGNSCVIKARDGAAYDVLTRAWTKEDGEVEYTGDDLVIV